MAIKSKINCLNDNYAEVNLVGEPRFGDYLCQNIPGQCSLFLELAAL